MKKLNKLARQLNEALKEKEEVKIYLQLKENILQNENIQSLLKQINEAQKEMKMALKNNEMKKYHEMRQTLQQWKMVLENDPLIVNYLFYKEEVYRIVEQISMILSE